MNFSPLFTSPNLATMALTEGFPWKFRPESHELEKMRTMPKPARRDYVADKDTPWNIYSAVGGILPSRLSKDNPPNEIRGIVVDYDTRINLDEARKFIGQGIPNPAFHPNFIEVTLSQNLRLVWLFSKRLLIKDSAQCKAYMEAFIRHFRADILLPGYDQHSAKPDQVWTNGGEWHSLNPEPLPWEMVFGVASDANKKLFNYDPDIPLQIVAEEVEKRFPGRWQGPFELNATGVRFWDKTADCPTGCQVKPDGMLCFTGQVGFMSWSKIFGARWADDQKGLNLGKAGAGIYFDGRDYWEMQMGRWNDLNREDVKLALKYRGISAKTSPGETASPVEKVLHHIQITNRVLGAGPVIGYPSGIIDLEGNRFLNISTVRALQPAEKTNIVPERDFPWLWRFLGGLFDSPQERPLDHFLGWTRRAFLSALNYRRDMGQAVFLCGPRENGKTLLCNRIIKPLLGNKAANPYDYFTGATMFNDELLDAPLLAINDEEATTREETRQKFIARLKAFVVNPEHAHHKKFKSRTMVQWSGRLFVTLNEDPGSVGLLPEVNSNTRDKMMFFASRPYGGIWPDHHELEATISKELPYFARWLTEWQPPKEVIDSGRMGVKSFFDPRILEISIQQSSAYSLLEWIQGWINDKSTSSTDDDPKQWIGTATELIKRLNFELVAGAREWTSSKVAKALTTLARQPDTGITNVKGPGRRFRIDKQIVSGPEEEQLMAA